jgi:hypothetical protein
MHAADKECLAVSLMLCVAAGTYCWWWRRKSTTSWETSNSCKRETGNVNERKPLVSSRGVLERTRQRRAVSSLIHKYEQQEAANQSNNSTTKKPQQYYLSKRISNANGSWWSFLTKRLWSRVAPINDDESTKEQTASDPKKNGATIERCPACRKTFSSSEQEEDPATGGSIVLFRQQRLHSTCFRCCDCQSNLLFYQTETVEQYTANVRIKFRCPSCRHRYEDRDNIVQHKERGQRVIIHPHEQGDTKQTMDKIGDDLTEAVYFMHPKCAVCGGDFFETRTKDDKKKMAKETNGNWRYHQVCWDTGTPACLPDEEMKTKTLLHPAHSARYLPEQIILQIVWDRNNPTITGTASNDKGSKNTTSTTILTTLYFVWNDREANWKRLRKENKNDAIVIIPYSLDEEAPANPNYSSSRYTKKQRRQAQPASASKGVLALPEEVNDNIEQLQLKLLAADEVAPRPPTMVEPISITVIQNEEEETTMPASNDNGTAQQASSSLFLCAKLGYFKFGLQYTLTLKIPMEECNAIAASSSNASIDNTTAAATIDETKTTTTMMNLLGAQLSVSIQE